MHGTDERLRLQRVYTGKKPEYGIAGIFAERFNATTSGS